MFAPTNSSARLINGQTVYKFLNITPFVICPPIKTINKQNIIMDEVFMFTRDEMKLILDCANNKEINYNLYLYGDPFQLKQPN